MKRLGFIALLLVLGVVFSSCIKDEDPAADNEMLSRMTITIRIRTRITMMAKIVIVQHLIFYLEIYLDLTIAF